MKLEINYRTLFRKMDALPAHATRQVRTVVMRVLTQKQVNVVRINLPKDTGFLASKITTRIRSTKTGSVTAVVFAPNRTLYARRLLKSETNVRSGESAAERRRRLKIVSVQGLHAKGMFAAVNNVRTFRVTNGVAMLATRRATERVLRNSKLRYRSQQPATMSQITEISGRRLFDQGEQLQAKREAAVRRASKNQTITMRKRVPMLELTWLEYGTKFMRGRSMVERSASEFKVEQEFRQLESQIYNRYGCFGGAL